MSLDVSLYYENDGHRHIVYDRNITHNLGTMAVEAGIYDPIWRPEQVNISKASDLIEPLTEGLATLKAEPEQFKQFEPANKWGTYVDFVRFVAEYLKQCKAHPNAIIRVSR